MVLVIGIQDKSEIKKKKCDDGRRIFEDEENVCKLRSLEPLEA